MAASVSKVAVGVDEAVPYVVYFEHSGEEHAPDWHMWYCKATSEEDAIRQFKATSQWYSEVYAEKEG